MIKIVNLPRAGGKTTVLVEEAIRSNLEIMVFDSREKARLLKTYTDLKPDQVFTYTEIRSRKGLRKYNATVIDNADIILAYLLDTDVVTISLSEPVQVLNGR